MTTATDNFNRADGAIGGNWGALGAFAQCAVFSNAAANPAAVSATCFSRRTAESFSADQYSEATILSLNANDRVLVAVRMDASAITMYEAGHRHADFADYAPSLAKWVNGTRTSLAHSGTPLQVGDVIRVEAEGTTIRMKVNGVTIHTVTDSAITAAGTAGMELVRSTSASTALLDTWSGGDLAGGGGSGPTVSQVEHRTVRGAFRGTALGT